MVYTQFIIIIITTILCLFVSLLLRLRLRYVSFLLAKQDGVLRLELPIFEVLGAMVTE